MATNEQRTSNTNDINDIGCEDFFGIFFLQPNHEHYARFEIWIVKLKSQPAVGFAFYSSVPLLKKEKSDQIKMPVQCNRLSPKSTIIHLFYGNIITKSTNKVYRIESQLS
jgi:hypothetical protein